jgi:hypothetical protein
MLAYAIKRVGLALLILIVVMTAMYAMVFLVPGDPASLALGPRATPALKAALQERMGLDQPIAVQLWRFLTNAATGDLGYDVWSKRPVLDQIKEFFPNTLILGAVALGWAMILGILLGCAAVVWRGTFIDRALGIVSVSLISVPSFVIAIYALLIFAVWLKWLPAIGAGTPGDTLSQIRALIHPHRPRLWPFRTPHRSSLCPAHCHHPHNFRAGRRLWFHPVQRRVRRNRLCPPRHWHSDHERCGQAELPGRDGHCAVYDGILFARRHPCRPADGTA